MIGRFFMKGIRLRWTFPGDHSTGARDGSVIADPRLPAGPMIYDGLDGELINHGMPHVSTFGLRKGMPIPYSWLVYSVGHTTKKMLAAGDVLTGFMSGCLIARWTENGMRCAGHIGTVDSSVEISSRVKRTFAAYMPRDTTGFNPAAVWTPEEIVPLQRQFKTPPGVKIMALVTTGDQFHSILLFNLSGRPGEWCVGGSKQVAPMNRDALYLALRKLRDN